MFWQTQVAGFEIIPLAAIRSQRVHQFAEWWQQTRGERRCPSRDDIDPAELKSLLPQFIMTDISYEPFDVRFRLCGTQISTFDEELTGKRLDDLKHTSPEDLAVIKQQYQTVCRTFQPVFACGYTASPFTAVPIFYEAGIWPLSGDGETVDRCAALQDMAPFPQIA